MKYQQLMLFIYFISFKLKSMKHLCLALSQISPGVHFYDRSFNYLRIVSLKNLYSPDTILSYDNQSGEVAYQSLSFHKIILQQFVYYLKMKTNGKGVSVEVVTWQLELLLLLQLVPIITNVGEMQSHIQPGLQRCDEVFQLFLEDHLSPVVSTNKTLTKSLRYR